MPSERTRRGWRDAGLCVECGAARTDAKLRCASCLEKIRADQAAMRRKKYKGACVECGRGIAKTGGFFRKCDACQYEQKRRVARLRAWRLLGLKMTHEEYERLPALQGGRCAICRTTEPGARLGVFCVDHDHRFGHVRGLLCRSCNQAIGLAEDSPARLRAAAKYIEDHGPELKIAK